MRRRDRMSGREGTSCRNSQRRESSRPLWRARQQVCATRCHKPRAVGGIVLSAIVCVPSCGAASLGAQVLAPTHAPPWKMCGVRGLCSCKSVCGVFVPGVLACLFVIHGYLGSVCGFLLAAACMHDCTPKSIPPVSEIALTSCSPVQGGMGGSGGPGNAGVGRAQSLKS